jgi:arylsulfatase A-like enzyme
MRYFILFFILFSVVLLPAQDRPNIVFIMADDHAAKALSCYDGTLNQTPNLDRIAQNGLLFENAFCTNSICSPVRAVNITGKMSHKNGVLDNIFPFDGSQPTVPKYLQAAGYETAMIGKWHLKSDPTGFDYWKVLPGQGVYYNPGFIDNGTLVKEEGYVTTLITDHALDWLESLDGSKPFFLMLHHKAPHRNWMPEAKYLNLYDDVQIPEPSTLFDDYVGRTRAAKEQEMEIGRHMYISYDLKVWQMENQDEDWANSWMSNRFESMTEEQVRAFKAAYEIENQDFIAAELEGKELLRWKYQRYMKDYLRCIASVDEQVGRVLDYLEQHGLDKNTLVVYTSDQGFYLGEHGWFDKRFMYEESYRMPLLMQWPGVIPAHTRTDQLVMNLDYAPTFMEMAKLNVPDDMQGQSLLPILKAPKQADKIREATYYHYFEYPGIHAVKRHYGIRTERYKLMHFYFDTDEWELYDLDEDPLELRNEYTNSAYAEIRDSLHQLLLREQKRFDDLPGEYLQALEPSTVNSLAQGHAYTLKYPVEKPSQDGLLTDGNYQQYNIYNAGIRSGYAAFREHPMELVLDLGEKTKISQVGIHSMQSPESWIHFPHHISVRVSKNGKRYKNLGSIQPARFENLQIGEAWSDMHLKPEKWRYIEITATPLPAIPDNLPGAGKVAWIFVDEVHVR